MRCFGCWASATSVAQRSRRRAVDARSSPRLLVGLRLGDLAVAQLRTRGRFRWLAAKSSASRPISSACAQKSGLRLAVALRRHRLRRTSLATTNWLSSTATTSKMKISRMKGEHTRLPHGAAYRAPCRHPSHTERYTRIRGGAATGIAPRRPRPMPAAHGTRPAKTAARASAVIKGGEKSATVVASSRSHRHGEDHALRPQVLDLCVDLEGCESVEEDPALAPPPCGPGRNTPPWAESLRSVRQPLRKTPADPPCVSALTPPSFPSGCDHHFYYQHEQHDQSTTRHDRRWRRTSRTHSPAAPPPRSLLTVREDRHLRAAAVHRDRRRRARRAGTTPTTPRSASRARSASAAQPIARSSAAASARSAPAGGGARAPRGEGGQGAAREGEESGGEARARGAGRRGGGDRRGRRRRAPPRGGGGRGGGEGGGGGGGGDARSKHRRSRPPSSRASISTCSTCATAASGAPTERATRHGRPRARCRRLSRRRRHHRQAIGAAAHPAAAARRERRSTRWRRARRCRASSSASRSAASSSRAAPSATV